MIVAFIFTTLAKAIWFSVGLLIGILIGAMAALVAWTYGSSIRGWFRG